MEWILEGFSGPVFTILVDTSLKGSLIAATLIGLTYALGRQRARPRGLLSNVEILMLLGLPLLTLTPGQTGVAPGPGIVSPVRAQTQFSTIPISVDVDHSAIPFQTVLALYGVGVLLALLGVATSLLGLIQLNRGLIPIETPEIGSRLASVKAQLGVKRRIRLARSESVDSPCQMGILRPTIVLPDGHDFQLQELDTVFLHEVVHVKRYDCLFKLLGSLCAALYWFNPLIWRVAQRNAGVQDQICDD